MFLQDFPHQTTQKYKLLLYSKDPQKCQKYTLLKNVTSALLKMYQKYLKKLSNNRTDKLKNDFFVLFLTLTKVNGRIFDIARYARTLFSKEKKVCLKRVRPTHLLLNSMVQV